MTLIFSKWRTNLSVFMMHVEEKNHTCFPPFTREVTYVDFLCGSVLSNVKVSAGRNVNCFLERDGRNKKKSLLTVVWAKIK
jgi:hypothetical protein